MSNLTEHAKKELALMGADQSFYGDLLPKAVLELIEVFSKQGHSGMSGNIVLQIFEKLAKFEPWMPLTGADDEWNECGDGVFQNKRCSHVFKQKDRFDGQAYDIQGKVFTPKKGAAYTGSGSHVPITFPYTPKTEYVEVDE